MNLKISRSLFKKLIEFLLISLIFPAVILAQELNKGILGTGLFTDSSDSDEIETLNGIAKTFNIRVVWTYDKTNIITGPLHTLAARWGIPTPVNGLEDPLLSEISGYQEIVIAHSAFTRTIVTLAKEGKVWGDKLYVVSPASISQDELRTVRDLTAQGKGFKEIVVYTGDDMIPAFKKVSINFKDYLAEGIIAEGVEIFLGGDFLKSFLDDYSNLVKETIGREPISITIYGDISGNKIEIYWKDGTIETSYLQTDAQTGKDFQNEDRIFVVPLYEGFPHGITQLELLAKFQNKYRRTPGTEDLELFKQVIQKYESKAEATVTTARDPNEKHVTPEGNIRPGDKLTYTINYENEGEGIAYGVYITDTLEEDLDDTTLIINNNGSYNPDTRTISWFIGEVGPAQEGSVTFSVNVKPDAQEKSEVINFATVYFPSVPEATRTNGTVNMVTTFIDNIAPTTTASISPFPNQAGWNNSDVTVTLTSVDNEDGLGIKEIHYALTGAQTEEKVISADTTQINISSEGITTLTYWAVDNAENIETQKTLEIKIDKTQPIITTQISPQPNSFGWNNTDVTLTFNATDNLSGIDSVTQPITITTEGENQHIGGEALDIAGNKTTTSITLNIDKTPPTVNITATPNILWPPNHKLVDVTIGGEATDNLSGIISTTFVVEDKYNTVEPIISNFNSVIPLEAWRNGDDLDGRLYTISVTSKDKADNQSSNSTTVICPHDQGKK